ncbi:MULTISPECIES: hypothetical protein [unclassified Vibrio]|uniref:Pili assembly chaperone N-terminal domain-containing protein n=1 Tax=Vibrio sp. HB236076 TaxID=3232307 RepID=A0AB39HKL5_9VIBR|nr:hypothetical protein [Vibrio sp. HB161653]MDP5253140.1 hypothetical protein [Vibrio sp. HB161653]
MFNKFLLLSYFIALPALANFNISPISISLSVGEKSGSYTLENLSQRKAAYQIQAVTREIFSNGEENLQETKLIRVFPSKIILSPGQKKRIKVIYLGKKNIAKEQSFRVLFNSLDLDVSDSLKTTGVITKYNFATTFYVTPKDAEADLNTHIVKKNNRYQLQLKNRGSKHIILRNWKLDLVNNQAKQRYSGDLPDVNILAGNELYIPLTGISGQYQTANIVTQ